MVPFLLFILSSQACLPIICDSFENEVFVFFQVADLHLFMERIIRPSLPLPCGPFFYGGHALKSTLETTERLKGLRMVTLEIERYETLTEYSQRAIS